VQELKYYEAKEGVGLRAGACPTGSRERFFPSERGRGMSEQGGSGACPMSDGSDNANHLQLRPRGCRSLDATINALDNTQLCTVK
jgi:hypothetical protein